MKTFETSALDSESTTLYYEPLIPALEQMLAEVAAYVTQLGYDPTNMWYSGLDASIPKHADGEHSLDAGKHNYFLGDFKSLITPNKLALDQDIQNEHWVVNPLKYALEGGTLAIYDPKLIVGNEHFNGSDFSNEDGFGTFMVVATHDDISRVEVSRIAVTNL